MTLVQKHPQDESYSFAVCVVLVGPRSIQRKEKWTGFQSRGVIFTQTQVIHSILKSKPIPFFLLQERSSLWPTIKQLQFRRGERHLPLENRHKSELKPERKKETIVNSCFSASVLFLWHDPCALHSGLGRSLHKHQKGFPCCR